jgi:hypothetical protein
MIFVEMEFFLEGFVKVDEEEEMFGSEGGRLYIGIVRDLGRRMHQRYIKVYVA